jgi:TP901 family phage tail tape measure protein
MAYNLPMQLNLQAPTSTNISKVKTSIENGLKYITIGSPTKKNLADIKKAVQAANIGNIQLNISQPNKSSIKIAKQALTSAGLGDIKLNIQVPSKKNISDTKKGIQNSIGAIKLILDPPSKANLAAIRRVIRDGIGTYKVILDPPSNSNLNKVKKAINSAGIGNINVKVSTTGANKATSQVNTLTSTINKGSVSANTFFDTLEGKARSFAAYAVVSTAILKLSGAVSTATRDAIDFEKELINISQTTGDSIKLTKDYSSSLVDISKAYNVTLPKTAQLARTLAQAGYNFKDAAEGAEILAKTSLLAGFDSLTDTTEGFIAVMATFDMSVTRAGQVLQSINKLSKDYAVESGDLVEAIKRTGGAFSSAGGSVEELLSLITAVRSTTRESAETISTGFRTIFARLQRPKTIEFFEQLGIQLETAEGQFIGPYQSILAINQGLQRLNITVGSTDFARVVEEIGGIRQISKVIPLLTQAEKAQEALDKANNAGADSIKDLEKAQQGLGFRLGALQKEFAALISEVVNSSSFKFLADVFINLSKAILGVISNLKSIPILLPALSVAGTFAAGRAAGQFLQSPISANQKQRNTARTSLNPVYRNQRRAARQAAISAASGGGVTPSVSPSFSGGPRRSESKSDDLFRETGRIINSMEDLDFEFTNLARHLGPMGKEIKKQYEVGEYTGPHGYLGVARTDDKGKKYVEINFGKGGAVTLGHEVGHAVDQILAKGSGKRHASEVEGTLQEVIVKALKTKVAKHLKEQEGVTPGSHSVNIEGKKVDYFEYRMRNQEIFADAFAKLDPLIQGIVSNTTDAKQGMQQIAELFIKYPDRFKSLYANIDEDLHIVQAAKQQIANRTLKEAKEDSARQTGALGGDREEIKTKVGLLRESGLTVNSRSAKRALQTEGQKQLGSQIKEVANKLKELKAAEKNYDDLIDKLKQDYKEVAEKKPATKSEAKVQTKQKKDLQNQYRQAILNARKTRESITEKQQEKESLSQQFKTNKQNIEKTAQESFKTGKSGVKKAIGNFTNNGGGFGYLQFVQTAKQVQDSLDKFKNKLNETTKSIVSSIGKLNITFIAAATYAQSVASAMKEFFGININQGALTTATVKGGMYSGAEDAVRMASTRKNIFLVGKALEKLPRSAGKFGSTLVQNAGKIATAGKSLANVLKGAWVAELTGGLLDAIFSTDYAKQTEKFIELGDAASAAAAAAKSYEQEFYRGIPIIGSFLSALGVGSSILEENLDSNGRLVVSNARLAAQINKTDKEIIKQQKIYSDANLESDQGKRISIQQGATNAQLDIIDELKKEAANNVAAIESAKGPSLQQSAGKGLLVAGMGLAGGTPISAAAGVIGGVAIAAVDYYNQVRTSSAQTVKAYELQSATVKKVAEIQSGLIEGFGSRLKAASIASLKAGGGYSQGFSSIEQQYGGAANLRRTIGFNFTGNLEEDRKKLDEQAKSQEFLVDTLKKGKVQIDESEKAQLAEQQAKIDAAEASLQLTKDLKGQVDATYFALEAEKLLMERRKIAAAAMDYQLQIMKQMESAYDGFNASLRDSKNIMEEIANVGTGKLTTREAGAKYGVGKDLFEIDAKEMMRTARGPNSIAAQMAGFATRAGAPGQEIEKSLGRLDVIDKIGELAKSKELGDLLKTEGEAAADPKEIAKTIYSKLDNLGMGVKEGMDPVLDEAIRKYAEKIAEGYEYAGEAEEAARQEATKQAEEIIAKQQEKFRELFDAEKQLREFEIELTNKKIEFAKKVYETEKTYFDERFALNKKVRDALETEPTGPARAGFIASRAGADRATQMSGLAGRRAQSFAAFNLGGLDRKTAGERVAKEMGILSAIAQAGGDVGTHFEALNGATEMLISTIRDEIDIEQQYLDGLIDSAKAQQEYTQALYDAQGAIVRDLVTGTNEDVGKQLMGLNAAAMAGRQGSLAGVPEDMRKEVFSIFDQFRDVIIPGLGKTGKEAQKEITKNEMMRRFGVDAGTAEQLASKAVEDRVPIDQRMADQIENQRKIVEGLLAEEKVMRQSQLTQEQANIDRFGAFVRGFAESVDSMRAALNLPKVGNQPPPQLQAQQMPFIPNNTVQNPNSKPIEVAANGQQQITISLPDIAALVNKDITSMVLEAVAGTFRNMAEGARTAQNFEDLSTAIANASEQTTTQKMGGTA